MIFYLSCTGNTKWAAQHIAKATNEELIFIPDIINTECRFTLHKGERIGFCFPVHGWRVPKIVRAFIQKLTIENPTYTYALCTAGDNIGETMDILQSDLSKRGLHVDSTFTLIMPESYVGLPFMNVDKPEKEKRKKDVAAQHLDEYIEIIIKNMKGEHHDILGTWPRLNSRILGGYFSNILITDKSFYVNSSKCVKCGICADVCPVKNIKGGLGLEPEWLHNNTCLTCFACYHHCPHHAIEYGKRTKNKGQYFFKD